MSESSYLFVYGSLRPEAQSPWSRKLASLAERIGAGFAAGLLFQLDGYPGMIATPDGEARVSGEVFKIHDRQTWDEVDDYEGCGRENPPPHEFERGIVSVQMQDGRTIEAWAYLYSLDAAGKARIESGDYLLARDRLM